MPKLKDKAVERNQIRIEEAALRIFTRQGYHGTSVREIADEAGVSLGNIYNYYETKEDLYTSLVRRYGEKMAVLQAEKITPLLGHFDPDTLTRLADAVREIVAENSDYWRLMYIDVVEFRNQHFSHMFQAFPSTLKRMSPSAFEDTKPASGQAPEFAFAAVYLQFFLYFLIETLFGGKQHMGFSDDEAIARLIHLATAGLDGGEGSRTSLKTGGTHVSQKTSQTTVRRSAGTPRNRRRADRDHRAD